MVNVGTVLRTCDNSGATICRTIKILGNRKQPGSALLGDCISLAVQRARSDKKIKKHDVLRAVVVRMSRRTLRSNGLSFYSSLNRVIIIDKKKNPIGTRIFGPVTHELRLRRFLKIIAMASSVL